MRSFNETLQEKAQGYFDSRPGRQYADVVFVVKAASLVTTYVVAYVYFIFFTEDAATLLLAAALLGFCHVLIPLNISHDAIHGAVSPRRWVNQICLYGLELTGVDSGLYSRKHLAAHQDKENGSKITAIESQWLLIQKKKAGRVVNLHWFVYLFYSQYMIFIRDYALLFSNRSEIGLKDYVRFFVSKALYVCAFLILPFILIDLPWWLVAGSLTLMYLVVTLSLLIVLLMPTEAVRHAKGEGTDGNSDRWATEILRHNVDFSPGWRGLNLLAGGSNMNVVHYLFPSVCHVHYNRLAEIIDTVSAEFGLQYRTQAVSDVFGIHYQFIRNIHKMATRPSSQ